MYRRSVLQWGLFSALTALSRPLSADPAPLAPSGDGHPFSAAWLRDHARELSRQPYERRATVPEAWRNMTYDQYKAIWFDTNRALWANTNLPFRVDGFAPGLYFPRAVDLNVVSNGIAQPLDFDLDYFVRHEYAPDDLPDDPSLGFSGLRLRAPLTSREKFEEFFVMQGASYFRAIAPGQTYGLSARGLSINTAGAGGEEFPEFVGFWVEEPLPEQDFAVIHALLNSPSATGAYQFHVFPGETTVVDVRADVFAREPIEHLGLAPLTSMFLFDETNRDRFSDFRSAVHDSDGLLIHNGAGEALWRPLANHQGLEISNFIDENPRGFGLMQRARRFGDFADLQANYHRRPSLWVEPAADWGSGAVTLVEIPTKREIYDNIVAYWRPREPLAAGDETSMAYRLLWGNDPAPHLPLSRVLNTRIGANHHGEGMTVAIDFAPHPILPNDLSQIQWTIHLSEGSPSQGILQRNPETGGPRLSYNFFPGETGSIEFRVQLRSSEAPLSEVWLYRWTV